MELGKLIRMYISMPNDERGKLSFSIFLIVISLLFSGQWKSIGNVYICILPELELMLNRFPLEGIVKMLFFLFSMAIIISYKRWLFSILLGLLLIIGIFLSEFLYSFNLSAAAVFLIVFGYSNGKSRYVAIQLSILYLGSFLDKLYFDSWLSGGFIDSFFNNQFLFNLFEKFFTRDWLIQFFTKLTIVIEFILCVSIFFKKTRLFGLIIGVLFHFATTIFMEQFFGIFLVLLMIVYYSLSPILKVDKKLFVVNNKLVFISFVGLLSVNSHLISLHSKQFLLLLFILIISSCYLINNNRLSAYINRKKMIQLKLVF